MANPYAGPVQTLIDELGRLPGVGPKSAQRLAFHILKVPADDARRLTVAIQAVKDRIRWCPRCCNVAEIGPDGESAECTICRDPGRDAAVLCVVEEARDVVAVERTGEFSGRYHVLQGALNPMEGVGPDQLRIRELFARLSVEPVTEVILCTNPNLAGDATAMYLSRQLQTAGITVSRIASGLPVGGDLEYADELTLGRAIEGRRTL